jgi:tRNA 2-selenouridine synthase
VNVNASDLHHALARVDTVIDVRSPAEWQADHVPGAINLPVLSDSEREQVGTLYAQSPFEAKKLGAALVARNIARHLEGPLAEKPRDWRALVYCWRGGNRSNSLALVLQKIGWKVEVLDGGYAEFRRFVIRDLERLVSTLHYQVVCGVTGSGKSLYLRGLAREGHQVLDLEALAHHRGSLLGNEPVGIQPSQKAFESKIWDCLRAMTCDTPVYVESESKKIGSVQVPQALIDRMRDSPCIELSPTMDERVNFLCQDYAHFFSRPKELKEKLSRLAPLVSRQKIEQWSQLIDLQHWPELVRELLIDHYDPTYRRSMARNYRHYSTAQLISEHPAGQRSPDLAILSA